MSVVRVVGYAWRKLTLVSALGVAAGWIAGVDTMRWPCLLGYAGLVLPVVLMARLVAAWWREHHDPFAMEPPPGGDDLERDAEECGSEIVRSEREAGTWQSVEPSNPAA